jgi:hypothetical protein
MPEPTESESPGHLYNLLALYAALDKAVLTSDDPATAAIVEGFLPGTTGENRGWSKALEEFLGGESFPSANTALSNILGAASPPTRPQLSRLVYILGSLMHVPHPLVGIGDNEYAQGLGLAQPQGEPLPGPTGGVAYARGETDPGSRLLRVLRERFKNLHDWIPATREAVLLDCLDKIVASIPLCNACVTTQGGIQCVLVDTHLDSNSLSVNVSIDQVKAILDPRNWSKTAGEFFCKMDYRGLSNAPAYPNWGRVLETVSAWCGKGLPTLETDLLFFKADYPGQAVLQYELNPNGTGDGKVTVDKGWLKVATRTSTGGNAGVTVSTRKVVHINGLPPVAQKIFVCVMGYGYASWEMLLGEAIRAPAGLVAWTAPPAPFQGAQGVQHFTSSFVGAQAAQPAATPTTTQPATTPSTSGTRPTTAAGLAVSMFSDYLAQVANDSAELAAKWSSQDLTVDDLAKYGAKYGARLATEPWRFVERLTELPPRKPTHPPIIGDDGF